MHCVACNKGLVSQKIVELEDVYINLWRPPPTPRAVDSDMQGGPVGSGKGHGNGDVLKPATAAAEEDVRTLWVDYDDHGERFKKWRDLARESFTPTYSDKQLEGPPTMLTLVKHWDRYGDGPKSWFDKFCMNKRIEPTDRVYREMKSIVDAFHYFGSVDQVNLPSLVGAEILTRRLQACIDACTSPKGFGLLRRDPMSFAMTTTSCTPYAAARMSWSWKRQGLPLGRCG